MTYINTIKVSDDDLNDRIMDLKDLDDSGDKCGGFSRPTICHDRMCQSSGEILSSDDLLDTVRRVAHHNV